MCPRPIILLNLVFNYEYRKETVESMEKIYKGVMELVGNTPLVEASNIEQQEKLKARLLV